MCFYILTHPEATHWEHEPMYRSRRRLAVRGQLTLCASQSLLIARDYCTDGHHQPELKEFAGCFCFFSCYFVSKVFAYVYLIYSAIWQADSRRSMICEINSVHAAALNLRCCFCLFPFGHNLARNKRQLLEKTVSSFSTT